MNINTAFSSLKLNTKDILKDIEREELLRRKDAAQYAAKIMKKNVNSKSPSSAGDYPARRTGTLKKRIKYSVSKTENEAFVGSTDPKAHLLEFGHGDGKTKNKRPFIFPSLEEAEPEIISIMSKRYW